jgi:hypothetical protein
LQLHLAAVTTEIFEKNRGTMEPDTSTKVEGGMRATHRNLSTRTSKFVPVQQTFRAKKNLVKSLLFSALDNVIYNNGTSFLQSTKPLFTSQNRVETS